MTRGDGPPVTRLGALAHPGAVAVLALVGLVVSWGLAVREGDGAGLGFLSGHSAVAMSAAVMAMVALPREWRPVAALVAVLVGVARIVSGVDLPADVVGGWCFGALVALGGLAALDAVEAVSRDR